MKHTHLRFGRGFHVALSSKTAQVATMVIAPGDAEGDGQNRHPGADQWLFVVSGKGVAIIKGKSFRLKAKSLILIARNERHEIRNTGSTPLVTLNFYQPPAYRPNGDELPAGKP